MIVANKMKQRTIIQLLELLKENILKDDTFSGMCILVWHLGCSEIITLDEEFILEDYLEDNEPESVKNQAYWFPYGEKQPRIDWINEQIKKLNK